MENSKFMREEDEEKEEEWSNNETGWTKYFESGGNESGSAVSHIKEEEADGGYEIVEDDDSLASDASSGSAYFEQLRNRRSEDSEVKGHATCWFDEEVEEDHERRARVKQVLRNTERRKRKETSSNYNSSKVKTTFQTKLS